MHLEHALKNNTLIHGMQLMDDFYVCPNTNKYDHAKTHGDSQNCRSYTEIVSKIYDDLKTAALANDTKIEAEQVKIRKAKTQSDQTGVHFSAVLADTDNGPERQITN